MSRKLRASASSGDFATGSAQNDSFSTEYNVRFYDMVTWTHGRHMIKSARARRTSTAAPSTTTPTRWALIPSALHWLPMA